MSQDLSDSQLKDLWRQGKIPVVFKRNKPLPVLARIPFAEGNMEWLRNGRRLKPDWCAQFKAWEIPTAWFDSVIKLALRRHQEVYVIQLYREHQKRASACWNAEGVSLRMLLHGGEPRRWSSRRQLVRGFRNLCRVLGAAALFMPPSEGQEPRALTVSAQAIEGRKCAETAKVHPDLRIVYNLAYGVLPGEEGRFSLV